MPFAVSPFANLEPFDTYEDTRFDNDQALKGNPTVKGSREGDKDVMSEGDKVKYREELGKSVAISNL